MTRNEAVAQIREWAEEAENGNYHDMSAVLHAYGNIIELRTGTETLDCIAGYDLYPPSQNIKIVKIDE